MKKLAICVLLLLGACATPAAGPSMTDRMDWRCPGGRAFSARIGANGQAEVFAGGQVYHLPHVAGGQGARYSNGGVTYVESAGHASLSGAAGGTYDNCSRGG